MLRDILDEALSLVSLMIFGATLLVWCGIIIEVMK